MIKEMLKEKAPKNTFVPYLKLINSKGEEIYFGILFDGFKITLVNPDNEKKINSSLIYSVQHHKDFLKILLKGFEDLLLGIKCISDASQAQFVLDYNVYETKCVNFFTMTVDVDYLLKKVVSIKEHISQVKWKKEPAVFTFVPTANYVLNEVSYRSGITYDGFNAKLNPNNPEEEIKSSTFYSKQHLMDFVESFACDFSNLYEQIKNNKDLKQFKVEISQVSRLKELERYFSIEVNTELR